MRFYTAQHQHWCGIDLHARTMYVCILDAQGQVLLHKNLRTTPEAFLEAVDPFREGLIVAAECIFTWYWLADLGAEQEIPFVLGHALYMKPPCSGAACCPRPGEVRQGIRFDWTRLPLPLTPSTSAPRSTLATLPLPRAWRQRTPSELDRHEEAGTRARMSF